MNHKQQGLIKLIVVVIMAVLVLSYFRFDLRRLVEDKLTQENLSYLWGWVKLGWAYLTEKISMLLS